MDYAALISQTCPSAYLSEARTLNLAAGSGDTAVWDLMVNPEATDGCRSVVLGFLAERVDAGSNAGVLNAFFTYAARAAKQHDPETVHRIAQAAARLRIQSTPEVAKAYFTALRVLRIDIRAELAVTFAEDWMFTTPEDPTWQYYLYLADLGTEGAVDALAKRIAATASGNDVTNFLTSLASLHSPAAKRVFERYADDQRTAKGVSGPGAKISETVEIYLSSWPWK